MIILCRSETRRCRQGPFTRCQASRSSARRSRRSRSASPVTQSISSPTPAGAKVTVRSRRTLREDAGVQADLGRAEALLRSARAFLYETLGDAWRLVNSGRTRDVAHRALLRLAATQAASAATLAADLMFSAGSSASVYASTGLGRCVRDIRTAGQHITVVPFNNGMAGQAFLGFEMGVTPLMLMDDRGN
jgi:indole-3-acetate monooxygenase